MSKKHKQRRCRICKKRPVWIGGDVKNPGPVCKEVLPRPRLARAPKAPPSKSASERFFEIGQ